MEPTFTFGSPSRIRTYAEEDDETDVENEPEVIMDDESDDEVTLGVNQKLHDHKVFMKRQMESSSGIEFLIKEQSTTADNGKSVQLIVKPTASQMSHKLLNPYIYRNIHDLGGLDQLAVLLETGQGWEDYYNQIKDANTIKKKLNSLYNKDNTTSEPTVEGLFMDIVTDIVVRLNILNAESELIVENSAQKKIVVGGILAEYEYDNRSQTDRFFYNANNGRYLLGTEIKTESSYGDNQLWYRKSRGVQVLSVLYAFNCPIFLLTQKKWKLFVETKQRNGILTFPYGQGQSDHLNSCQEENIGVSLVKAIIICLLSKRLALAKTTINVDTKTPVKKQRLLTCPDSKVKPKEGDLRRSSRIKQVESKKNKGGHKEDVEPTFISGYSNGKPIYSKVRVWSDELVDKIEEDIKIGLFDKPIQIKQQSSEITMVNDSC